MNQRGNVSVTEGTVCKKVQKCGPLRAEISSLKSKFGVQASNSIQIGEISKKPMIRFVF